MPLHKCIHPSDTTPCTPVLPQLQGNILTTPPLPHPAPLLHCVVYWTVLSLKQNGIRCVVCSKWKFPAVWPMVCLVCGGIHVPKGG